MTGRMRRREGKSVPALLLVDDRMLMEGEYPVATSPRCLCLRWVVDFEEAQGQN